MALIRLQDNVPEPYVNQSRDFQLMVRAYDCILNGVKFDIDSMRHITNTDECNSKILQLLQTKVGFFSDKNITDDELRYVLRAFPTIIKNKGSLKGIKQAVWTFLKLNHIKTSFSIIVYGKDSATPYTIQIGIEAGFRDTTILDEILRYILPTGYTFSYVFYTSINNSNEAPMVDTNKATIIYVSDSYNSALRGETNVGGEVYSDAENRLVGAVDTMRVASSDGAQEDVLEEIEVSE